MASSDPRNGASRPGQPGPPGKPGQKPAAGQQRSRQDALGNKVPDPAEEIAFVEKEIHELKIAFEQYVLGIDRHSPARRRDALAERLRKLKSSGSIRNTALKFRLEMVGSKFSSYDRMWTRSLAEAEAGISRRDQFRMKQRRQKEAEGAPPPAPVVRKAAPPANTPGLSDGQLRALYDAYIGARARTNEPTHGITLDALSTNLRRQVPELLAKHGAKAIDFKVVIKNGRALLKAVPRK